MTSRTQLAVITDRRANSLAAFGFGAGFVLMGFAGLVVSAGHQLVGRDGGLLLGVFQVNMLHNLLHIAVGAVLIAAGIAGARSAKVVNTAVGLLYLALFFVGPFVIGSSANLIALNGADHILHLALGSALTAVGLRTDRDLR